MSAAAAAHAASASSWRRGSVDGSWLSCGRGDRGSCACWVWAAARKAAVEGQCCSGRGSGSDGRGTAAAARCCRTAAARCAIECPAAQWIATPERSRLQACAGSGLGSWVLEQQPPAAMAAAGMSGAAIGALAGRGATSPLAACCERAQQRIPSAAPLLSCGALTTANRRRSIGSWAAATQRRAAAGRTPPRHQRRMP